MSVLVFAFPSEGKYFLFALPHSLDNLLSYKVFALILLLPKYQFLGGYIAP
jgi:hypothetical protein